jgi:hypothetical protein
MDSRTARRLNDLLLLGGLAGLLILAFLLDTLRNSLLTNAGSSEEQVKLFFLFPLMELVLMLAALGLIWLFLSSAGYSRWITVVYLVFGLVLLYTLGILSVLPFPDSFYNVVLYLSLESYLFQAGGAAAALGLIGLFFWKADKKVIPEAPSFETSEAKS